MLTCFSGLGLGVFWCLNRYSPIGCSSMFPIGARIDVNTRASGGGLSSFSLASQAELGPVWHCNGIRRPSWYHDGQHSNLWIVFGAGGRLQTSNHSQEGSWKLGRCHHTPVATFGKCHHTLQLLVKEDPLYSFAKKES